MPPVIIYKTDGPWGAGKGSNLDEPEVDQNFYNTAQAIQGLETNPPQPVSIDHFVIEGTLLTIVLTDGTQQGPFVLPIAQWRWTGQWQPLTQYFVGDITSDAGNLYFIRVQHISEDTFDPALTGPDGQVYVLILTTPPGPYDIAFYFRDLIIGGTDTIALHVFARVIEVPSDFAGAIAKLTDAPSSTEINLPIFQNDTQIGVITFAIGDTEGSFTGVLPSPPPSPPSAPISFAIGDTISIALPVENDDTARGLVVTIPGQTTSTA